MTLKWHVDDDARLIVITATGTVAHQDIADYLGVVAATGAGYRTAIDARAACAYLKPGELVAFSQLVGGRQNDAISSGRIAIVLDSEAERMMAGYFADRTDSQRPCRLFLTLEDAMAWLESP